MKKCVVILFSLAIVFAASYASAEGNYQKVSIGVSSMTDSTVTVQGVSGSAEMEFDPGFHISTAFGSNLGNNDRLEIEVAYNTADLDRATGAAGAVAVAGDVNVLSFLLNWYYDIKSNSLITPFIGGGIGIANVEVDSGDKTDDRVFAYQAGAGLGYAVNDSMTLELGYRYMGISDPEFQDSGKTFEVEASSHNFYAGIRVAIQ